MLVLKLLQPQITRLPFTYLYNGINEFQKIPSYGKVTKNQLAYFHSMELKWQKYSNKLTNIHKSESLIKLHN